MNEEFEKKCLEIKEKFAPLSPELRMQELIRMGRNLPLFPKEWKTEERKVEGCQSALYLAIRVQNGNCFFDADGDALISKGLAALMIAVYSGETAETILKCPPLFIEELGIGANLSPHRSNGLAQIHLKMKRDALKTLL